MAQIIIDAEKCVCCGDCAMICPVSVYNKETPPCQIACPLNTDIEGYLSLVAQRKFAEADELVREVNPLPISCGRVCTRPCEAKCNRAEIDEPIAICSLKRFVTDYEPEHKKPAPVKKTKAEKVAIIGAGPAGLAAAHDLAKLGYGATIFEALPVAGGILYTGIPRYRLPKPALRTDIDYIKALGVEIKTDTPVGGELTIHTLRQQGYEVVLLAMGAQKGLRLGMPGEDDFEGVIDCMKFLMEVNLGKMDKPGDRVIVIGGGNAAIDSARSALRLGATDVHIACLESREGMPATASELAEAEEEGITIHPSLTTTRILGDKGRVTGVECLRLRGVEFDEDGQPHVDIIEGTEHILPADMVIFAIGQTPDLSNLVGDGAIETTKRGTIAVDPETLNTSCLGVFAAGDVVRGPTSIVEAIADGKKAALSIDKYLGRVSLKEELLPRPMPRALEKGRMWGKTLKKPRQRPPKLPLNDRIASFKEVDLGFTTNVAVEEARRCLGCGVFNAMDVDSCCGLTCRICMNSCWQMAIRVLD